MNLRDIAYTLGISNAMVSRLAKMGMPTHSIEAAEQWRAQNLDLERTKGFRVDGNNGGGDLTAYRQAREKRAQAEAAIADMRARRLAGELVDADRVRRAVTAMAAATRAGFDCIPDKLADRLAASADPAACHALLAAEIDQVLADLSNAARNLRIDDD